MNKRLAFAGLFASILAISLGSPVRADSQDTPSGINIASNSPEPLEASVETSKPSEETDSKRYLFDVSRHGPEQIEALLRRAEAMSQEAQEKDESVEIAMVLHGPDIEIFASSNYEKYGSIVDLAARLDESRVIDFKVCQVTAENRGLSETDFPAFIEVVPLGPAEISRLGEQGYITL